MGRGWNGTMPRNGNTLFRAGRAPALAAALGALLTAVPLAAQASGDYRLPGAAASPGSRAAGPVDPTDPTIGLPRTRPSATPSPEPAAPMASPSATPRPTPAPSAAASPRPAAPRPLATSQARPAATQPAPTAVPSPDAPATSAPIAPIAAPPSPSALPAPLPAAETAPLASEPLDWRPWTGGAALLLALLGALVWWRRRKPAHPVADFEPPPVAAPAAPDAHAPAQPAAPIAAPSEPAAAAAPAGLALSLEARRMTASLMATTLSYAIRLTNTGPAPLAAVAVEGDLVSAHASLPVERQIANDSHRLELRHAHVALAPGESIEFTGDMRLPLTEITPIRAGAAAYFVPLVRLRVEAEGSAPLPQVLVQTFVIGELPDQDGGALRPFRLDLGPRTYSRIGQRPVA